MGFTTGFTGGVTFALGLAYLAVLAHERNRQSQAQALRSQSRILHDLLDPTPLPSPQTRAGRTREERGTLVETAKDRWNDEVENAVRWVQRTDWNKAREGMEGAIARLLGGGLQRSRESIEEAEKKAGPIVQDAVDRSKANARKGADQAAVGVDRATSATVARAERADAQAKEVANRVAALTKVTADKTAASTKGALDNAGVKASEFRSAAKLQAEKTAADAKAGAHDTAASAKSAWDRSVEKSHEVADKASTEAISTGAGTVDAARGAVRNITSKDIEKGKEAIGKAQAAIGVTTEKVESEVPSNASGMSAVEKALHERYEKPNVLNKSVEEALEERYKPIDSRDNTVLRGV